MRNWFFLICLIGGILLNACATQKPTPPVSEQPWLSAPVPPFTDAVILVAPTEPDPLPWYHAALDAFASESVPPPHATRTMLLLSVGFADGLSATETWREAGHPVSEAAVIAQIGQQVLRRFHPHRETWELSHAASLAHEPQVWQTSARLSDAIVADLLVWAEPLEALLVDEALSFRDELGVWNPTPPAYLAPQAPRWGQAPLIVNQAVDLAPPPPAWDSAEMITQQQAFAEAVTNLGDEDRALARYWAAAGGTVTPPGMWFAHGLELAAAAGHLPTQIIHTQAALAVALYEAGVSCWKSKYHYRLARPIDWMQRSFSPTWSPLLVTPNHPAYPSGHASFSAAAATVLVAAFPDHADALNQAATDAAHSRIVGGIHWPFDGQAGLAQGEAVGRAVAERLGPIPVTWTLTTKE